MIIFSFAGTEILRSCGIRGPHAPHILGEYGDGLTEYCLGRPGETPEGTLHIRVESSVKGDPWVPSTARGEWWIE